MMSLALFSLLSLGQTRVEYPLVEHSKTYYDCLRTSFSGFVLISLWGNLDRHLLQKKRCFTNRAPNTATRRNY